MSVRCTLVVLGTLALGATAGCTGGADPEATTPTSSTPTATHSKPSPSTTTSRTSTATRQGEGDLRGVRHTVVKFSRLTDELAMNPKASLDRLATLSRGQSNTQWTQILTNYRRKDWKQVGSTSVEVTGARAQGDSRFVATACLDVSEVNLIDKHGKSVVATNRPPRVAYRYTIQKAGSDYFITKDKALRTC